MRRQTGRTLLSALLALTLTLTAFARHSHSSNDRASFGSDINIAEGETVGDVACAFCSVHIRGDVTGDVAVAFGSVTVAEGRTISGDTAILKGNLNLGEGSTLHGDLAIMAGSAHLADGATINGSRSVIPEPIGTLMLLAPFAVLIGIIWLIVYLVRRNRYRFPAYPQGRGIQPPPPPPSAR
jgi:hypothetical protein